MLKRCSRCWCSLLSAVAQDVAFANVEHPPERLVVLSAYDLQTICLGIDDLVQGFCLHRMDVVTALRASASKRNAPLPAGSYRYQVNASSAWRRQVDAMAPVVANYL